MATLRLAREPESVNLWKMPRSVAMAITRRSLLLARISAINRILLISSHRGVHVGLV